MTSSSNNTHHFSPSIRLQSDPVLLSSAKKTLAGDIVPLDYAVWLGDVEAFLRALWRGFEHGTSRLDSFPLNSDALQPAAMMGTSDR